MKLRVDPFLAVACAAAWYLGRAGEFAAALFCITTHECAHALTAKLLGMAAEEIRITPVGAFLQTDGAEDSVSMALTALAGPVWNLVCAALFQGAQMLHPHACWRLLWQYSLLLGLFNLLPAFPMDGGRVVFCFFAQKKSRRLAERILCLSGIGIGAVLMAFSLAGAKTLGVHLPLLILGLYAVCAAFRMRREQPEARMRSAIKKETAFQKSGMLPVRELMISENTPISAAAQRMDPSAYYKIFVVNAEKKVLGVTDETHLLHTMTRFGGKTKAIHLLH